jgi:hypothetical protein
MKEQNLGSMEVNQQPPVQTETLTAITQPTPTVEATPAIVEKQIPQSQVGKIAGASRKEGHDQGYQKGYEAALAEFYQRQAANTPVPVQQSYSDAIQQNAQPHLEDLIAKKTAEIIQKQQAEYARAFEQKRAEEYVENLGSQIKPKIEAAKEKFEDFDSKVNELQLDKMPADRLTAVMEWLNSVPNSGEVLYDIANNPHKLGILMSMHTPALAMKQIHAISQSLQNNQAAQDKSLPRNPLSVVQPSIVGKSTGELTGQAQTDQARQKYRF